VKQYLLHLVFLSAFCYVAHGQKIISRQKDNFSNLTTLATSQVTLVSVKSAPVVEVSIWMQRNADSATDVRLNVVTPAVALQAATDLDSIKAECLLKTSNGQVIRALYRNDSKVLLYGKYVHGCSYQLQWKDLQLLAIVSVTDIKFSTPSNGGGAFEIVPKNQGDLEQIAQLLITAK